MLSFSGTVNNIMEMQCSDVQSFLIPNDVIADHNTIQVLRGDDDVIIAETDEVTLVEEVESNAADNQQNVAKTIEVDTTMMAFVKFVQQSDGTLTPVGLVPAEEIGGKSLAKCFIICGVLRFSHLEFGK